MDSTIPPTRREARRSKNRRVVTVQESGNLIAIAEGRAPSAPEITLRGQWLVHAGFIAGHQVDIIVEEGRLTIVARV